MIEDLFFWPQSSNSKLVIKIIKKSIFILMVFTLFSQLATAQQYYDTKNAKNNDDYFITAWRNLKNSITNYNLEISNLIPTGALLQGLSIMPQYERGSDVGETRINNHHSSIDIWKLKVRMNSEFINLQELLGFNLEIGKEVTYIQQYNKKFESILRWPYNPMTKIPLTADHFFKKNSDDELVFKEGDLIVFKVPLVLGIDKSLTNLISTYTTIGPGISYSVAGVFNIQIFRMKNNYIRVTIINSFDKTVGGNFRIGVLDSFIPGYYVLGFNAVGAIINNNLFNDSLFRFSTAHSNVINHSYDFIFNLNSKEACDQYNKLIGKKFNLFGFRNYDLLRKSSGIFENKKQISKSLEINFNDLYDISKQDVIKPLNERRIITVSQGESQSDIQTISTEFNLLNFFKYHENSSENTTLSQNFVTDENKKEGHTFLSSNNNNSMDSFFKWRSREYNHKNMVFTNDEKNQPKDFNFYHAENYTEDRTTTEKEFIKFKDNFLNSLPETVKDKIGWPDWFTTNKKIHYSSLRKEIFINNKIFKSQIIIGKDKARSVLTDMLKSKTGLTAVPMISKYFKTLDDPEAAESALNNSSNLIKYSTELEQIPQLLATLFSGADILTNSANQYKFLEFHMNAVPLLKEIGIELILKCLEEKDLEKVLFVNIYLSTENFPVTNFQYPVGASLEPLPTNRTAFKNYVSYNHILGLLNFTNNKSYRLWLYFNQDSSIIDLNKIISK